MRSDREHCASRAAVEQEEEERRGGEEQVFNIKSNNSYLTGGELKYLPNIISKNILNIILQNLSKNILNKNLIKKHKIY